MKQSFEDMSALAVKFSSTGTAVKNSTSVSAQKAETEKLSKAQQEYNKVVAEGMKLETDYAVVIERQRQANAARKKELQEAVAAERLQKGSIQQLEAEVKKLERLWTSYTPAQREANKALGESLTMLRNQAKELRMATGDMKVNVGNYRQSLDGMNVTVNNAKKSTGLFGTALGNLKQSFSESASNAGKMESTMAGLGATVRNLPGPVGMLSSKIADLGGMLKMGMIGVGIAAVTALIWAMTKAFEAVGKAQDEIIEKNIAYMRSLAALKGKLEEYYTWAGAQSDTRSSQEKAFAENEMKRLQAREIAMQKFNKKRAEIYTNYVSQEDSRNRANEAAIELGNELKKIDEAAAAVTNKITREKIGEAKAVGEAANSWDAYVRSMVAAEQARAAIAGGTFIGPTATMEQMGQGAGPISKMTSKPMISPAAAPATMTPINNPAPETPSLDKYTWDDLRADSKIWNEKIQIAQSAVQQIDAIISASYQSRLNQLDQEAMKDESNKEKELARVKGNKAQEDAINAKYAQKEAAREKERRRLEVEQAKYKKTSGIIQAIINTAISVTGMLANPGGILGVVLAALAAATGAAEVAVIASQPIPSYATGRKGGKAEFANVGEVGRELIVHKDGSMVLTPPTTTTTFLPEGSSVIPHDELLSMTGRASSFMPVYSSSTASMRDDIEVLKGGFMMLNNTIRNKREVHLNFDKRGFAASVRNGQSWEEWVNNNVRL